MGRKSSPPRCSIQLLERNFYRLGVIVADATAAAVTGAWEQVCGCRLAETARLIYGDESGEDTR